uniref:Uncharacterized protein n=1 Tax=Rhizophora mucronata TaxID=61149 RepID=A0A2P2R533_RHIMU
MTLLNMQKYVKVGSLIHC